MLMATKVPLPAGHPSIERFVCSVAASVREICYNHPAIHANLLDTNTAGYSYPPGHRSLQAWAVGLPGYPNDHDNVDSCTVLCVVLCAVVCVLCRVLFVLCPEPCPVVVIAAAVIAVLCSTR